MPLSISPNQDDIFKALGDALTAVLLPGTTVNQGQVNRVAEPKNSDFIVMWPLRFPRLATNIDEYADCQFTASMVGTVMTVTAVDNFFTGTIKVDSLVFGPGVTVGTKVSSLGSGSGGTGTYNISPSQTVSAETMAAGTTSLLQKAECVIQVDVHGPHATDNAQIISTTFRDEYGVELFGGSSGLISPLYADDPRQMPFMNAEQQYENRAIVEVHLQVNQTVIVPQQFATAVEVDIVEAEYPPL